MVRDVPGAPLKTETRLRLVARQSAKQASRLRFVRDLLPRRAATRLGVSVFRARVTFGFAMRIRRSPSSVELRHRSETRLRVSVFRAQQVNFVVCSAAIQKALNCFLKYQQFKRYLFCFLTQKA